VTEGALQRAADTARGSSTFRDEILLAGSGRLGALLGLDLVTGLHGEQRIGAWGQSFVPQRLRELVGRTENAAKAKGASLVTGTTRLHQRQAASATGGSVQAGRCLALVLGLGLGAWLGASGFMRRRSHRRSLHLGRLVAVATGAIAIAFGILGIGLLALSEISIGHIWSSNLNAWLFVPLDLWLLVPATRWLRSGQPALTRGIRIYLNLRILLIGLAGLGALGSQDNGAFALAAAGALLGLRAQPAAQVR
jgi:hypothetical protein